MERQVKLSVPISVPKADNVGLELEDFIGSISARLDDVASVS
jgi:hypothetical protein